jgi:O-acetyl-ADP-ribose deacetylase (regulator of RNase III)
MQGIVDMKAKINKVTIEIVQGSIFALNAAAIVTVTDPNLNVDAELLARAGPSLYLQTQDIRWSDIGTAVITNAGSMTNASHIIHTVGPHWGEFAARANLALCTWHSLELAEQHKLKSIALPPISTGSMGYPLENCAKTMLETMIDFTFEKLKYLKMIIVCVDKTPQALQIFENEFSEQLEALRDAGEGQVYV